MLSPISLAMVSVFFFVCAWSLYNLPILAAGVRGMLRSKKTRKRSNRSKNLPTFSIVVPVKNERKVIGRLLDAFTNLDYPADKKELIIVEDGSTDETVSICRKYAEGSSLDVKILCKQSSDGKPSALNFGVAHATGEIVGIFDADSVPARDALLNVCGFFADPAVAAVQGRTLSINAEETMLSKFISHEETVWCEVYLQGKDALNLFVHLKGSCQFIKRDVLEKLKGFDENALSEDMELSARLAESGYKIRYAPNVQSWQESATSVKSLFRQRTRWLRGTMEVAFRYGRLMSKPSLRNLDAEVTLLGPFVLIAALATYFSTFYTFLRPLPFSFLLQLIMQASVLVATLTILVCGLGLIYSSKPRKVKSLLWLPFIYFYWSLQAFISFYAVLLILLHRPRKWLKTEKKGVCTERTLQSLVEKAC